MRFPATLLADSADRDGATWLACEPWGHAFSSTLIGTLDTALMFPVSRDLI